MADGKSDLHRNVRFVNYEKLFLGITLRQLFYSKKTTRLFQSKIDTAIFYAVNDEAIDNRCADQSQASV